MSDDQSPDLPVIAYEDIKPGMVVEERRLLIRQDSDYPRFSGNGSPTKYYLVSAPEPDPDAEKCACAWADYRKDYSPHPSDMTVSHKAFLAGWDAARDEYRAGGSDD